MSAETTQPELIGVMMIEIYDTGGVNVKTQAIKPTGINPHLIFLGANEIARDILLDQGRAAPVYRKPPTNETAEG